MEEYRRFFDKPVVVKCTDGEIIKGTFSEWVSAADNEPGPEAVIIENVNKVLVMIFVDEIDSIAIDTPYN